VVAQVRTFNLVRVPLVVQALLFFAIQVQFNISLVAQ
jgi:hypothetical protein